MSISQQSPWKLLSFYRTEDEVGLIFSFFRILRFYLLAKYLKSGKNLAFIIWKYPCILMSFVELYSPLAVSALVSVFQDIVDYLQDLTSQGQRSPSPAMSSPCPSPPAPPLCQNPTAFTRLPIPTQWATVTSSLQACHKTRPGFPVSMSQDTGTGLSVPVSQNSFPTPSASPSVDKNKQEARMVSLMPPLQ